MNKKTMETRGGANRGQGRKRRVSAHRHNLLLEDKTFDFFTSYGNGIVGKGIDLAANTLGVGKIMLPDEVQALRALVEYVRRDEQKDFEGSTDKKNHIYTSIQILEKFMS